MRSRMCVKYPAQSCDQETSLLSPAQLCQQTTPRGLFLVTSLGLGLCLLESASSRYLGLGHRGGRPQFGSFA